MKTAQTSHIFDVVDYLKGLLTIMGTWPQRNPSWSYRMKRTISWSLDISILCCLVAEIYKNYLHSEFKELTELLSIMTSFVSWSIKRTIFEFKNNRLVGLFEKLEDPVLHDFPKCCDAYVHRQNRFTMIMAKTFQFIVANLTTSSSIKPFMNAGLALHFTIFDLGNWYYPFHIYEIIAMINASYNNSTMDCVAMSLMSICGTQFEILKQKIIHCRQWAGRTTEEIDAGEVNVGEDMDPNLDVTIKQYLNSCVEHHIKILDIAGDVENIFCYLLLSQFATSVLAICNTWFQFMLEDNLIKILFLSFYALALLNQIALYCLYGDQVMQKSQDLRDACYMSDWYKSNKMVAKNMLLIMERAKRPTVITAGKLSVCNLVTYAGLIRMSYSYFALMNRLYGDMGE